jgi:hypothetical protein
MLHSTNQRRRVKEALALLFLFILSASTGSSFAQTLRPIISEYRGKANGRFELVNDSFAPVNVVLETKSFTVTEDGEIQYRPLDPDIKVKFSATSFRIQPKQTYAVTYQATTTKFPSYFVVYASFSGLPVRTNTGMNIRLMLPHTVYLLGKDDARKAEITVATARYDAATRKVMLELQSHSANFGRVQSTEIQTARKKVEAPGFPVYPGKNRKLELDWSESAPPEKAVFYFDGFKIEAKIER